MKAKVLIAFFFILCSPLLWGDQTQSYKSGEAMGAAQMREPPQINPEEVPGFKGSTPPEALLYERPEILGGEAHKFTHREDLLSPQALLLETQAQRGHIILDREHDPLLTDADRITENPHRPLEVLEIVAENQLPSSKKRYTCHENAEPLIIETREYTTHVKIKQEKRLYTHSQTWICLDESAGSRNDLYYDVPPPTKDWHKWNKKNHHYCNCLYNFYDFYERDGFLNVLTNRLESLGEWQKVGDTLEERKIKFSERVKEHISLKTVLSKEHDVLSIDKEVESLVDDLSCTYVSRECIDGPETRTLQGTLVTRECWAWRNTYECQNAARIDPQEKSCLELRASPLCHQIESKCLKSIKGRCLLYEQVFECDSSSKKLKPHKLVGNAPYCLDGTCSSTQEKPNEDFNEVISKLSLLKEVRRDMDIANGLIFKGTPHKCRRFCFSFLDCCQRLRGWGSNLRLSACEEDEKLLSRMREEGLCVFVGTYCAEKVFGICLRKKSSFCCFPSKLARIIHEQGRAQLGISFGDAENPNCRALSIEEFSRIDFNKINLSEIFQDIWQKVKVPDSKRVLSQFQEDWKRRLPQEHEIKKTFPRDQGIDYQLKERRHHISGKQIPSAYSLSGNPPPAREKEELPPQTVF